ncbi:hypothetical protein SAY87_007023 [Trapa incisa]|uniref:Uncharacterized protein n=1 Tax=Trapa incisa TaxID=236973 RepID=A0AAN7JZM0_9MYRT|nr:hypothetical protein SAY87_007023 [Trapa incisa]
MTVGQNSILSEIGHHQRMKHRKNPIQLRKSLFNNGALLHQLLLGLTWQYEDSVRVSDFPLIMWLKTSPVHHPRKPGWMEGAVPLLDEESDTSLTGDSLQSAITRPKSRAEHGAERPTQVTRPPTRRFRERSDSEGKKTQLLSAFSQHGTVCETMKMMTSLQASHCKAFCSTFSVPGLSVHFPLAVGIFLPSFPSLLRVRANASASFLVSFPVPSASFQSQPLTLSYGYKWMAAVKPVLNLNHETGSQLGSTRHHHTMP